MSTMDETGIPVSGVAPLGLLVAKHALELSRQVTPTEIDPQSPENGPNGSAMSGKEKTSKKQLDVAYKTLINYAKDLRAVIDNERKVRRELSDAYYGTLIRLAQATALKDGETGAHLQRISHYSKLIALTLGYSEERAQMVFDAAPMHDVGKMGIPDAILQKKGPLDNVEWDQMKKHTELGARLLGGSSSKLLRLAETIALCHHERWDGTGYPNGLAGEAIPEEARIVMLADQYDALRSERPYKLGFDHETTCRIILHGDKRSLPQHFDPRLLDLFQVCHPKFAMIWRRFHGDNNPGS